MSETKNDSAWQQLFEKHRILEQVESSGRARISAANINKYREARLMTKFDHRSQLPKLFADNNLSILPISRGEYEIGSFETFHPFDDENLEPVHKQFPTFFESIDHRNITSESTAINCAFVSEILHDFTGESELMPTVSGRMGSSSFCFKINSRRGLFDVNVENSQVEIDGGYEGENSLCLIEAKNYISSDFIIRQLYYPFRLWREKISKQVRLIFQTYSNGIFHLREYEFENYEFYNSIRIVKHKKYTTVWQGAINTEVIQQILDDVKTVEEPRLPFPQADSFDRVINLCEQLKQRGFLEKDDITQNYDFDARQTDYYSNAAKYIGLVSIERKNNQTGCTLTKMGRRVLSLPIVEMRLEFVRLILSHKAFSDTLKLYFEKCEAPSKAEIVEIMKRAKLYNIDSESTYERRASTIISWVNWILNLIEE